MRLPAMSCPVAGGQKWPDAGYQIREHSSVYAMIASTGFLGIFGRIDREQCIGRGFQGFGEPGQQPA